MAGRYLATELQDDNGDVIYPHTEADIVFASDGTTVEENLSGEITDEDMQNIFDSSQTETGKKLSVKEKVKNALRKYQKLLAMKILDTVEEVEANTDEGYLMGARAGAEIINNLTQQPSFIYDANGKITGYKTQAGADTVFPFSSKNFTMTLNIVLAYWDGKANTYRDSATGSAKITCTNGKCTVSITNQANLGNGQDAATHIRIYSVSVTSITFS